MRLEDFPLPKSNTRYQSALPLLKDMASYTTAFLKTVWGSEDNCHLFHTKM